VSDLRSIQKQLAQLTASIAKEAGDSAAPTFGEVAARFLAEKKNKSGLRDSTKTATDYQHRRNLVDFAHIPIDKFGGADWNAWVVKQQQAEEKKLTRFFNARKAVSEVLNFAHNEGIIDRKPKLDNPDEHRNVGRTLSEKEVWGILRNCTHRIFRLFFYTMAKMGCRPREILRWEWDMIEWGNDTRKAWISIPARITKTGRSRRIPLNGSIARQLKRLFDGGAPARSRYVFPNRRHHDAPQLSYHGAWKTACRKAGVVNAVPYDFRRTFITKNAAAGKPLLYVAKLLDTSPKMIDSTYAKEQVEVMEDIIA
jgi:integrase